MFISVAVQYGLVVKNKGSLSDQQRNAPFNPHKSPRFGANIKQRPEACFGKWHRGKEERDKPQRGKWGGK